MYDIDALEQQWKRYRRKRLLLPVAGGVLLLAAGAGIGYFVTATPVRDKPRTVVAPVNATVPPVPAPERSASQPASATKMKIVFSDEEHPPADPAPSRTKKVIIEVTPKKSSGSVQQIESRFAFAKDKDDALFLARYYYEKKAYDKALKWALETNKLDSDIEESWLIFARAKAKLGERIEAIRVLQAYYDRSGSERAKDLLSQIRRGKAF